MPGFSISDEPATPKNAEKPAAPAPAAAKAKPLSYKERLEFDGIMDKIAEAEAEATKLEAALADPTLWSTRAAEAPALQARLDDAKALAATLTERWEELEARSAQKT
jgi:ATP-binding cassette subfamily F protein uup